MARWRIVKTFNPAVLHDSMPPQYIVPLNVVNGKINEVSSIR